MIDIQASKGAIGAEYQKSPWDEKGISMPPPAAPVQEPVQQWAVFCGGCRKEWAVPHHHPGKSICAECETKLHTTPPAQPTPDLQAELEATNRQVEILSDALAESRRAVNALVALARADEREACADIADRLPRIYRETAEAHYRLSPEPFKPSQFGFDYAELRQAESITYAIRARGNT